MRKGHDVLIEAAARLAERWPDVHFVLAGERYSDKAEGASMNRACGNGAPAPRWRGAYTSWAIAAGCLSCWPS